MIGLAGPYDFLPFADADVQNVFRSASRPMETQPIYFADRRDPNLLLLTGDADTTVKPRNAERLARVMRERGGNATLIKYHGVGHITLLLSLARSLRFIAPTLRDATRFISAMECN